MYSSFAWYLFKPVAIALGKNVGQNAVSVPPATNTHQSASSFNYFPSNGGGR
ncbi:TPA: hypothetical protein ACSPJ7_005566 [Bacillus cereus]